MKAYIFAFALMMAYSGFSHADSAAKTFNISGQFVFVDEETKSDGEQCVDGVYYQVVCIDWASPGKPQFADVDCDGSVGSFEINELTSGNDFSCFIRKSDDQETYENIGSVYFVLPGEVGLEQVFSATADMKMRVMFYGDQNIRGYLLKKRMLDLR